MKTLLKQLLKYGATSGIAALVNFLSRFGFSGFFDFGTSVVLAYCTGMVVNFVLSKYFAFDSGQSGRLPRELLKFFLVALVGLFVTYIISMLALRFGGPVLGDMGPETRQAAAHLAGMAAGFAANFVGHKLFSFRVTGLWDKIKFWEEQ